MSRSVAHIARRVFAVVGLGALCVVLGLGWHGARTLDLTSVDVRGAVYADVEHILELAAVPDSVRLFSLNPHIIEDRVERAPWVGSARATRWLNGTLSITVRERVPVALVLDASGAPYAFLDAAGYSMPISDASLRSGYDLPLLTGRIPRLLPTQPVEDPVLRRLLAALPEPGTFGDALISGIERRPGGQLILTTAPGPEGSAITVRLGRDGFDKQLRRLEAFWEQVVLTRSEPAIRLIDLRFDDQIVTSPTL